MPKVIICEPVIYCPVCGFKRDPNNHKDAMVITGIDPIINGTADSRYISFECVQCKTKLVYDTKEETIRIRKLIRSRKNDV